MASYHEKYLLGFVSDGQGNWETTDRTKGADIQQFIETHASDGALGTTQTRMVYFAGANRGQIDQNGFPFNGAGGLRDVDYQDVYPNGLPWGIEGFICEFVSANSRRPLAV